MFVTLTVLALGAGGSPALRTLEDLRLQGLDGCDILRLDSHFTELIIALPWGKVISI
jgi:hypothetical protein